jgi:hypothetical protein
MHCLPGSQIPAAPRIFAICEYDLAHFDTSCDPETFSTQFTDYALYEYDVPAVVNSEECDNEAPGSQQRRKRYI